MAAPVFMVRSSRSSTGSKATRAARTARVQPGVRNLAISEAAAPLGLYYAPDPSSQIACTIGGNVAENSGGVHCLKYGLTLHNVLRVRGFTVEGESVEFGSEALDTPGLDLLPLVAGYLEQVGVKIEIQPLEYGAFLSAMTTAKHSAGYFMTNGHTNPTRTLHKSFTPGQLWGPSMLFSEEFTAKMDKAYAITNPMEYFAESTEAMFTRNDFYPYNREELKKHDPAMFDVLVKLWGLNLSATAKP